MREYFDRKDSMNKISRWYYSLLMLCLFGTLDKRVLSKCVIFSVELIFSKRLSLPLKIAFLILDMRIWHFSASELYL